MNEPSEHPVCKPCLDHELPMTQYQVIEVKPPEPETCACCGEETEHGLYIRLPPPEQP